MSDIVVESTTQNIIVRDGGSSVAVVTGGGGGAGSDGFTYKQDTPPAGLPNEGQTWFDTSTGNEYVRFDGYWVQTGPGNGQGIGNGLVAKCVDVVATTSIGAATWTDIPGAAVSFTAKAGRTYRVTYCGYTDSNHGAITQAYIGLYTSAGTQLNVIGTSLAANPGPGDYSYLTGSYISSFTPGLVSLKLRGYFSAGAGNLAGGASTTPCQLVVEDITPSSGGSTSKLAPACLLSRTVGQSIPTASTIAVLFDAEGFDNANLHDLITNTDRITVPVGEAGLWMFSFTVTYASNNVGYRSAWMQVNGVSSQRHGVSTVPMSGGGEYSQSGSILLQLTEGDYVHVITSQTSGGALSLLGNNTASNMTSFYGVKISD